MQENGPFRIESGGTKFHESEFSWNRETNLLYIEQPAGVGYSYCEGAKDCTFTDHQSGQDNLTVVLEWFNKFPEFKNNDLWISGESYAGVYVPYLAHYIVKHNEDNADDDTVFKPNLKGFAVGNGVTNWKYDTNAAYIDMSYWHSLIDSDLHDRFVAADCDWHMPYMIGVTDECMALFDEFNALTATVNVYDIFGVCWGAGPYPQSEKPESHEPQMYESDHKTIHQQYVTQYDYTPWLKWGRQGGTSLNELPPCTFGSSLLDYMNSKEVRTAMSTRFYLMMLSSIS